MSSVTVLSSDTIAAALLTNKEKKLAYIDALRGWAILGVVLVHTLDYGAGHNTRVLFSFRFAKPERAGFSSSL